MGIYFIGCYSDKLNLAVQNFLEPFGGTLGNIHKLKLKLKRLKKRAALRRQYLELHEMEFHIYHVEQDR